MEKGMGEEEAARRENYGRLVLTAIFIGGAAGIVCLGYYALVVPLLFRYALSAAFVPGATVALPAIGLFLGGLILTYRARSDVVPPFEGTLEAYHGPYVETDLEKAPWKAGSAIPAVGLGGSAGIETPAMYVGSVIANLLYRRLGLNLADREAFRIVLICGMAAGFAAVFKAPIAATLVAVEIPYRRGISMRAVPTALISALIAYGITGAMTGWTPVFATAARPTSLAWSDIVGAVVVGLICGGLVRIYVIFHELVRRAFDAVKVSLFVKMLFGGVATGFIANLGQLVTGTPLILGPSNGAIEATLENAYHPLLFVLIAFFKAVATTMTLASGAFGGFIEPLVMIGASIGAAWGGLVPLGAPGIMPTAGMAGFFAAALNAPLGAGVFAAESTGSVAALIPALIVAGLAWFVSGHGSVVRNQR